MSSAVVQIYAADRNAMWSKRCCGIACLVKDNPQRSYFIRIYDIKVRNPFFLKLFFLNLVKFIVSFVLNLVKSVWNCLIINCLIVRYDASQQPFLQAAGWNKLAVVQRGPSGFGSTSANEVFPSLILVQVQLPVAWLHNCFSQPLTWLQYEYNLQPRWLASRGPGTCKLHLCCWLFSLLSPLPATSGTAGSCLATA